MEQKSVTFRYPSILIKACLNHPDCAFAELIPVSFDCFMLSDYGVEEPFNEVGIVVAHKHCSENKIIDLLSKDSK